MLVVQSDLEVVSSEKPGGDVVIVDVTATVIQLTGDGVDVMKHTGQEEQLGLGGITGGAELPGAGVGMAAQSGQGEQV